MGFPKYDGVWFQVGCEPSCTIFSFSFFLCNCYAEEYVRVHGSWYACGLMFVVGGWVVRCCVWLFFYKINLLCRDNKDDTVVSVGACFMVENWVVHSAQWVLCVWVNVEIVFTDGEGGGGVDYLFFFFLQKILIFLNQYLEEKKKLTSLIFSDLKFKKVIIQNYSVLGHVR